MVSLSYGPLVTHGSAARGSANHADTSYICGHDLGVPEGGAGVLSKV